MAQPQDLRSTGDMPTRDQFLECHKHYMQKYQYLSLGTSPSLSFSWAATVSLLGNTTLGLALSSPFPTPQMILSMSQSAAPLQAPLVAMGLDP